MADIILKKATDDEIPEILEVEKKLAGLKTCYAITTREEWDREMKDSAVYAIIRNGKIVGDICYEIKNNGRVMISGLMIDPEFQNQGIGSQALEKNFEELKFIRRIDLAVHPRNNAAIGLYLRFGFVIEAWKENFYGDGQPRLIMARENNLNC